MQRTTTTVDPYTVPVSENAKKIDSAPSSSTNQASSVNPEDVVPGPLKNGGHVKNDLPDPNNPDPKTRDDFDAYVKEQQKFNTPYFSNLLEQIRQLIKQNPGRFDNLRQSLIVIQNENDEEEEFFLIKHLSDELAEKNNLNRGLTQKLKRSSFLGNGCFGRVNVITDQHGKVYAVKKVKIDKNTVRFSGDHPAISATRREYLFYYNVIRPLLKQYPDLQRHVIFIKGGVETLNSKAIPTIYQVMEIADGDFNAIISRLYPSIEVPLTKEESNKHPRFVTKTYSEYRVADLIQNPVQYKNLLLYLIASAIKTFAELEKHGVFHSDIKPDNLLLVKGLLKASDFGGAVYIVDGNIKYKVSDDRDPGYSPPEIAENGDFNGLMTKSNEAWRVGVMALALIFGVVRKYHDDKDNKQNSKFIIEPRKPEGKVLADFFEHTANYEYDYTNFPELIKALPKNPETVKQDEILETVLKLLITTTAEARFTLEEVDRFLDEELAKLINFNYREMQILCDLLFKSPEEVKAATNSLRANSMNAQKNWNTLTRSNTLRRLRETFSRSPSSSPGTEEFSITTSTNGNNGNTTTTAITGPQDMSENNNNRPADNNSKGWSLLRLFGRTQSFRNLRGTPTNDMSLSSSTNKK